MKESLHANRMHFALLRTAALKWHTYVSRFLSSSSHPLRYLREVAMNATYVYISFIVNTLYYFLDFGTSPVEHYTHGIGVEAFALVPVEHGTYGFDSYSSRGRGCVIRGLESLHT